MKKLLLTYEELDSLYYENLAISLGLTCIAGVDEVGRGSVAGPVVASAVILPAGLKIDGVKDSKQLNEKKREELEKKIKDKAQAYSYGVVEASEIDSINIRNATIKAMQLAIENLKIKPSIILIDGNEKIPLKIAQRNLIKGDVISHSISCASILAKVYRDNLMKEYSKLYPEYDFKNNKGYLTQKHKKAILKLGLTPLHRRSFLHNLLSVNG